MDEAMRAALLRVALVAIGAVMLLLYPLMMVWPSGWRWQPYQAEYELMLAGVYATLGVFLILAARRPAHYLGLIWFAVWSSAVHGGIMLAQALADPAEGGHLLGDVPALFFAAVVLAWLAPRRTTITLETGD